MASNYQFIEPGAGFPNVSATVSGTAGNRLGILAGALDPTFGYAEFMYVRGAAASAPAAGDAVIVNGTNWQAVQAVSGNTASQGKMGIAPAALSNTNVFGWVQVYGICDYANMGTQGTGAVGLPVVIGSTAGRLQTTAGATGFIINGLKIGLYSTTANSNSGILDLNYPNYDGRNQ